MIKLSSQMSAWLLAACSALVVTGCTTGGDASFHDDELVPESDSTSEAGGVGAGEVRTHREVAEGTIDLTAEAVGPAVKRIDQHLAKIGALVIEEEARRANNRKLEYTFLKVKVPAAKATAFVQWLSASFNVTHSKLRFGEGSSSARGASGEMVTIDIRVEEPWEDHVTGAWVRIGARSVGAVVSQRAAAGAPSAPVPAPAFRHGNGIVVMLPESEAFNMAVDVFDRDTETQQPVLVTLGGSGYSTYLGSGRRAWLNPTLGMHAGYASFDDIGSFVLDGELGLELVRWHAFLLHTFGRGMVLMNKNGSVLGREYGLQLLVPF